MRKWFAFFVLLAVLLTPLQANAQGTISFTTLDVSIWPEYDTPTVLVIYKITLAPQTSLPSAITLRLPSTVQKPNAVAVGKTPETITDQDVNYKFEPGVDFSRLTITATGLYIQMEYYDPGLTKNGSQRQYTYEWMGDFAVDQFRFELRKPLQSSNMTVQPALDVTGLDSDGFQLSEFRQPNLSLGQKLTFSINYQRDTDSPSTSFLQVQSSAPLDQNVPGQSTLISTLISYLPRALGALGLVLLFIAGWIYWVSSRTNPIASKARKRHVVHDDDEDEDQESIYCGQCGKRAQPDDRFCRTCGARIRRSES